MEEKNRRALETLGTETLVKALERFIQDMEKENYDEPLKVNGGQRLYENYYGTDRVGVEYFPFGYNDFEKMALLVNGIKLFVYYNIPEGAYIPHDVAAHENLYRKTGEVIESGYLNAAIGEFIDKLLDRAESEAQQRKTREIYNQKDAINTAVGRMLHCLQ